MFDASATGYIVPKSDRKSHDTRYSGRHCPPFSHTHAVTKPNRKPHSHPNRSAHSNLCPH